MKRYLILALILATTVTMFAQDSIPDLMRKEVDKGLVTAAESVIDAIVNGITDIVGFVNWLLFLIIAAAATMFNESVEAQNKAPWLTWVQKYLPRGARTAVIGLIAVCFYAWAFRIKGRVEIFSLLITIFVTMFILSTIGNKLLRWVFKKAGWQYNQ